MKILLSLLLFSAGLWAQSPGYVPLATFSTTQANLASIVSPATGMVVIVTNSSACTSTTGSGPIFCRYNGATWDLVGSSGSSTPGNFNVMPIFTGTPVAGAPTKPDAGGATAVTAWAVNISAPGVSKYLMIDVETVSGTGCTGGTCGYVAAFYDATLTTAECVTTVATSGGALNINALGWLPITWASGAAVSGGLCTYQPGWVFVHTSDSTALALLTNTQSALYATAAQAVPSTKANLWAGFASPNANTGNGASLAFATLTGFTWGANGTNTPYILLAHQ